MKKLIFISFFLVATAVLLATTLSFTHIDARPDGDNVLIEWTLGDESGVKMFEVYRFNNGFYTKIADKEPKGNNSSYKYIDPEAFIKNKKNMQVQEKINLKYKIKVKYDDGSTRESEDVEVSYNISSVKRTWGMIKELFR